MTAKKLPRRTMSMAKKASATAEKAADLDLLENAIGDTATNNFSTAQLIVGIGGAVLAVLAIMLMASVIFGSADTDHSMLPDGYREATGLAEPEPTTTVDGDAVTVTADTVTRSNSPFPSPQSRSPIIVEVTCPAGTVEILTGERPADTVCIVGTLGRAPAPASEPEPTPIVQRIIVINGTDRSTVGGTDVPDGLHCAEDEAIAFDGIPDTLFCVHIEEPER